MVSRKFLKKKQGSRIRARAAKGKPAFRDCITRGKHRVQNGVPGKCGPRKTEKYFRLIMNRVPEYSHLVFIIPVYLRTITLSKSLVIVQLLYTRYPIVARALGLAAFRPSASREQRYLAYKSSCSWTNKKVQLSWTNQKVQLQLD